MKFKVTSCSIDLTGDQPSFYMVSKREESTDRIIREEVIDTETNRLFADCENEWDVEDVYSGFWNRLNEIDCYEAPYWTHNPEQKIIVIKIERVV